MQGQTAKVCVVIPIFNGGKHLRTTLQCVEDQDYQNIEVVLINNGSTDDTKQTIEDFLRGPVTKLFRVLHYDKPSGMVNDWNKALNLANGKYIKLLPADDVLSAQAISKQVRILEGDPTLQFVVSRKWIITDKGTIKRYPFFLPEGRLEGRRVYSRCIWFPVNLLGEPGAGLIRSDTVAKVGGFDPALKYYVDLDFWLRLLKEGDGFFLDGKDYFFRVHGGSGTVRARSLAPLDFVNMCRSNGRFDGKRFTQVELWYLGFKARIMAEFRHQYIRLRG